MIIFKGCPRCRGDIMLERDVYGDYLECLQCGNVIDQDSKNQNIRIDALPRWTVKDMVSAPR